MLEVNYFCIRCMASLTGKQKKFCSDFCRKKVSNKRWKKKHWRKINAIIKTRKIKSKIRREMLIEQEVKRREELKNNANKD